MKMTPGIWNIPTPAESAIVVPDVVLAPVLGFDEACYRLGNGGGYFDRTLAVLQPRPLAIGIGYERLRIRTIYPQPHDVAMDVIVTEQGVAARAR
jgi:5,10-methenyltetrahydrofolate synthetase